MHLDANWVAAIGQVAGAIATVAAVVVALRIAARDRRQHERDRIDEAAGRAAMVFARDSSGDVVVINYGDRPVRDVRVRVAVDPGSPTKWTPSNFPGNGADMLAAGDEARTRGSYYQYIPGQDGKLDFVPLDHAPKDSRIVLEFVDTEGRCWVRDGNGLPVRRRERATAPHVVRIGPLSLHWDRPDRQTAPRRWWPLHRRATATETD